MDPLKQGFEFDIKTFGCKVNTYDAGLLQKQLQEKDHKISDQAQVHVVNTCAVTQEATKEAIRHIRKLKRTNPEAKVVVTGCSAQVDGQLLDHLDTVDLIVANSHKSELEDIVSRHLKGEGEKIYRSNIFRNESLGEGGGHEVAHTRSFLKIQDGCNSFCTFCIIPYARGKSRSLSVSYLIEKVNQIHAQGTNEVVLTGVHIGDYLDEESPNGPYGLDDMIEILLQKTKMPRFRLTSLEPVELTDKLMSLFENPRLCSHFHMSIQSAHTRVLKDMKRQYTAEQVEEALHRIQETVPSAFVGMDVIVGFPGETEEDFVETFERLQRSPWTRIHVFPYSERAGTRAALSTEVVPYHERKERARRLRALSLSRYTETAERQVGKTKKALLLKGRNGDLNGLTRDYWPLKIMNQERLQLMSAGDEVFVRILKQNQEMTSEGPLLAEVVGEL